MYFENPFDLCPEYETDQLLFTKVKSEDALELLEVYSDKTTIIHMNNDNCGDVWQCHSIDVMNKGISSWNQAYEDMHFIRWTVRLKINRRVIGTIELAPAPSDRRFFYKECSTGILRVDLKSEYETKEIFSEIYRMTNTEMIEIFGIEKIITKCQKDESERLIGLNNSLYKRLPNYEIIKYPNYYISYKW